MANVAVIVALDVPSAKEALHLLDRLPAARWVKVGPVLLTREGGAFTRELVARGLHVFLDLKWHDIPNTVAGAVTAARELGVAMVTVHALAGAEMLQAAAAAAGGEIGVVGVTVLTSHDAQSYRRAVGRTENVTLETEVQRLATTALAAGLRGIVCSPHEVVTARRHLGPEPWLVVPGIRREMDPRGDQVRVATARDAAINGATHLVVGRPIIQAADPAAVFRQFVEEAQCVER